MKGHTENDPADNLVSKRKALLGLQTPDAGAGDNHGEANEADLCNNKR